MCGIYFSVSHQSFLGPDTATKSLLESRGPDSAKQHDVKIDLNGKKNSTAATVDANPPRLFASFFSSVLSLRGDRVVAQPLIDESTGSVLCWNGEAWEIGGSNIIDNDSIAVFHLLLQASAATDGRAENLSDSVSIAHALSLLNGPYAFIYCDRPREVIYFGRDRLGRRSLLRRTDDAGNLHLSSVCAGNSKDVWQEVEADGLYALDVSQVVTRNGAELCAQTLNGGPLSLTSKLQHIPYRYRGSPQTLHPSIELPWPPLNSVLTNKSHRRLSLRSSAVQQLEHLLRDSLRIRVRNIPRIQPAHSSILASPPARLAILFSGGLDCTLLARLAHDLLPSFEPIDLLNVAFENPRIHGDSKRTQHSSPYESCPDRITARANFTELQRLCRERTWRLVEINVPYTEMLQHRETIVNLMHPHNTQMDLSIACALYFAARGSGVTGNTLSSSTSTSFLPNTEPMSDTTEYRTPARVLLSGLGADELFAGYQRHTTAFTRHRFPGLIAELALDFERLGKRNLGRDDRVVSHWGREVRYPYLDERIVAWTMENPVWEKCGFGEDDVDQEAELSTFTNGHVEREPQLEPGKKILRLLAWRLGMTGVAKEKKRAIQFGARTAKMETGKSKGTQKVS